MDILKNMEKKEKDSVDLYHYVRRHLFGVYEKYGDLDRAFEILDDRYRELHPNQKAGLKGELLFYHEYKDSFRLETLLDVGVKADFTGLKNSVPTNFDVTTNMDYKKINDYVNCIQKRGKKYEIVLVDLKKQNIEFFPLRFPICKNCGMFSHYVLYLLPPTTEFYHYCGISDVQKIILYCSHCDEDKELEALSFEIPSLFPMAKEIKEKQKYPEARNNSFNFNKFLEQESIPIVRFMEKETQKLISALAENEYIFTGSDGEEYWQGHLHWKHPLVKDLGEAIPVYYGSWF